MVVRTLRKHDLPLYTHMSRAVIDFVVRVGVRLAVHAVLSHLNKTQLIKMDFVSRQQHCTQTYFAVLDNHSTFLPFAQVQRDPASALLQQIVTS